VGNGFEMFGKAGGFFFFGEIGFLFLFSVQLSSDLK